MSSNIDYMSLFSAIIGGLIAIIPSFIIEKYKWKKEKKLKGSYEVLIPLVRDIEEIFQEKNFEEKINNNNYYFNLIFNVLEKYLYVDKEIFLDSKIKYRLKYILKETSEIDKQLEKEYDEVVLEYKKFILEKLNDFRCGEYSEIEFMSSFEKEMKRQIIIKQPIILSKYIEFLEVVYYEEFWERRDSDKIKIGQEERNIYGEIKYDLVSKEDLNKDSYELLNFLEKNIDLDDEKNKISSFLEKTESRERIIKFLKEVNNIKTLIKESIELE